MGRIRDADGKRLPRLDILHGLMGFGQIQDHGPPLLHRPPGGVHHIDAAVFIVSGNHQDRHWENALGDIQLHSHCNYLTSLTELTGSAIFSIIIAALKINSSTIFLVRYCLKG